LCKQEFQSDRKQIIKSLISLEIKGSDFPFLAVLPEVMWVCAPVGVNAYIASGNAISRGNQPAILS
jgi:hypothetical protein